MRWWRILCTGLVYLTFGVATAFAAWIEAPVRRFLGRGSADLVGQRALHRAAGAVRWVAGVTGAINLTYEGVDRLAGGPRLIVANHPTSLDATFMIAALEQLDNVVEFSWMAAPVIRGAVESAGYICNNDPRRVIAEAAERLEAGRCLLIFPEGSRSPSGALHDFHRGAARIAMAAGLPVQPVVIHCLPPFGLKGKPWYDIPEETPQMTIRVGELIEPAEILDGSEAPAVAARKVTAALRDYFIRELNYADD